MTYVAVSLWSLCGLMAASKLKMPVFSAYDVPSSTRRPCASLMPLMMPSVKLLPPKSHFKFPVILLPAPYLRTFRVVLLVMKSHMCLLGKS